MENSNERPLGWTTVEEAKQLVDAGLNPDTADMLWEQHAFEKPYVTFKPYTTKGKSIGAHILPCWSLGALIKLMPKTISIPIDERSAYFYDLEWQFANDNSLRYIATNRGKCLIDIYSDHDIGSKSFIETAVEMVVWLIENRKIK